MMGKLSGALGYLSGAMEYAEDAGVGWRREFCQLVRQTKPKLEVGLLDPTDKPKGKFGCEDTAHQTKLQQAGKFRELQQYVRSYRRHDLHCTDSADFIIVVVNHQIPQWGTANETYVAESRHIPSYFVCENGLYNLPRWLFDVIDKIKSDDPIIAQREANVFNSIEEVVDELVALDQGTKPLSEEWELIRLAIKQRTEIISTSLFPESP
ncbi:MAG: hypothetical protein ACXADB_09990 [Candidatus Hermodarchaeia archaeon]|jgi:hypothetical protein